MNENYLNLDRLSVGYNGNSIIRDISLTIKKGEIITLIGPNGAGKTTILKSLAKQLAIVSGVVMIGKDNLTELSYKALAKKMAVVLTERLHPELMTCYDIVATGRYPYTGNLGILNSGDEKAIKNALHIVHGEDLAGKDFNSVSDGQKQRILLARAICQEPEIIILDEPTSYLDIRHKLELLSILRSMAKEKQITIVMSLHEIDLAEKLSDRIICVKGETISGYGRPEEIFHTDVIHDLYDVKQGNFDTDFGSMELPKIEGSPEVFVLSACGTGIPIYRKLQRAQVPFAAGILYKNDIDYRIATLLAAEVIAEEPFREISDKTLEKAMAVMKTCGHVICAGVEIGDCNKKMELLIKEAKEKPEYIFPDEE